MSETSNDIFDLMKKAVRGSCERGYCELRKVDALPKFGESGVLYAIEGDDSSNFYIWNGVEFETYMTNVKVSDPKPAKKTFAEQIAALKNGGTIKLSADTDIPDTVVINKKVTLNLNGHKLNSAKKYPLFVDKGASLTINDSTGKGGLKAVFNENEAAIMVDGGSLTINGGNFEAGSGNNGGVVFLQNGGSVTINDGTFSSPSAVLTGNNTKGDMNIKITGGTLTTAQGPAIYDPCQGKVEISGGTINGGVSVRMGQVTVSDGTINAPTANIDSPAEYYNYSGNPWLPDALYSIAGTYNSKNTELGNSLNVNITGGKFNVTNGLGSPVAIYDVGKVKQKAKVTVTSGEFVTNAADRHKVDVLSLSDIGVTEPKDGCGTYSGNVVTDIAV